MTLRRMPPGRPASPLAATRPSAVAAAATGPTFNDLGSRYPDSLERPAGGLARPRHSLTIPRKSSYDHAATMISALA